MQERLAALRHLLEIIDTLRGPKGCPWDRAQSLESMGRYLLEESSEAVDAIEDAEGKPVDSVCDELGDVLMNVFLCARIAEEADGFDISSVARTIAEKLIRRHPHVFANAKVEGVGDVLTHWNAIKEEERKSAPQAEDSKPSRLDSVPRNLPLLERAHQLSRAAAKTGFDWPDAEGALRKVLEEAEEVAELLPPAPAKEGKGPEETTSPAGSPQDLLESELGDLLFAVTNLCRKLGVSPSTALRKTLKKFCYRFQVIEERFPELEKVSLEEMEAVWQEAKKPPTQVGSSEPGEQSA